MKTKMASGVGEADRVASATAKFLHARRTGVPLDGLDEECRPRSLSEALAIQDAVTHALNEQVRGWKVVSPPGEDVARGALMGSRVFTSPASLESRLVPMLAVEGEVAFVLREDIPAREATYERAEIATLVSACPALEVLSSRFRDFKKAALYEWVADHFLNGAFIHGQPVANWRDLHLDNAEVTLAVNGKIVVGHAGGHPSGDPLLPLIDLANHFRVGRGLRAGEIVTTGSFTGVTLLKPGDTIKFTVTGLGSAEATFTDAV